MAKIELDKKIIAALHMVSPEVAYDIDEESKDNPLHIAEGCFGCIDMQYPETYNLLQKEIERHGYMPVLEECAKYVLY